MTERDYGKEIDALREQLENLQDMVQASLPNKPSAKKLESVQVMQGMHPDSRLSDLMEELCHKTEERNGSGLVSYLGIYQSGGRQSNWIRSTVPTEDLLSSSRAASQAKYWPASATQTALRYCWRYSAAPSP